MSPGGSESGTEPDGRRAFLRRRRGGESQAANLTFDLYTLAEAVGRGHDVRWCPGIKRCKITLYCSLTCGADHIEKGLIFGLGSITLLAATTSRQYLFNVPLSPHLTRDHQLWRLMTHHLAFTNSVEFFVATLLLFYTSVPIERTFGSRKYASFLAVTTLLSTVVELFILILGSRFGFTQLPAGPFAIIFAILYQSARLVPTTFTWKVFGLELSSRSTLYILGAQLISSQPPLSSLLPSLAGILSSYLYRSDFLHMRSYRLSPRFIALMTRFLGPVVGSSATPRRGTNVYVGSDTRGISVGLPGAAFGRAGLAVQTGNGSGAAATPPRPTPQASNTSAAPSSAPVVPPSISPPSMARTETGGFMQQWSEGITGNSRQPAAAQVTELSAIFPDEPRAAIISALQRSEGDLNRAVEAMLAASS